MKTIKIIVTFISVLYLSSCSADNSMINQSIQTKIQQQWRLISIDQEMLNSNINSKLSITADNKVSGNLACNHFFGELNLQGDTVKVNKMGSTRKMCQAPQMHIEHVVSSVLSLESEASLSGDKLILKGASHQLTYLAIK